jgi:hypothetical protein
MAIFVWFRAVLFWSFKPISFLGLQSSLLLFWPFVQSAPLIIP